MSNNSPLRIAVLINNADITEWQLQLLKRIEDSGTGTVVLAVVRGTENDPKPESEKKLLATSLFYRYQMWDRKKFSQKPDPFAPRSLGDLNTTLDVVTMTPDTTQWVDRLNGADAEKLRGYNIDVSIRFGWRILKGDILNIPRCGTWSFHHGDNRINRGGPPGIWEHFHNQECTGITLQLLSENLDDGIVIDRSITATDKSSVTKTRHKLYWRSIEMLPRKIAQLHRVGWENFLENARTNAPQISFYSQPLFTEKGISLKTSLRYIWTNFSNYVKQAVFEKRFEEKWVLYFKLSDQLSTSLWQFTKIESPNDRYWADPFVIERDNTFYVFAEEFMYNSRRGRICVIPVSKDGTVGNAETVLEPDYHLSYPFIFEHEGEIYMIPESSENRSIDLYKCTDFPSQWEHVKTLMSDVRAVDTTLHFKNGRWWMFTNSCFTAGGTTHDELHLFSAENFLTDEWTPHQDGVVVSDVCNARPAGAFFELNSTLYRPAQNCSFDYGYGVKLHEVEALDDTAYREKTISEITPDWNEEVRGVHTLNYVPGMTIVDAKTFITKSSVIK